ncbi:MAG: EamA family transporter [Acidobacteria bacterium]|jgi:drug/metabolite transporter (DMT)-like permease|nr:EamA family transporter [Acidobacteriota bacterium]
MPAKLAANRLEIGIFLLLCLFWGTTWLAIKLSLATIPPVFGVAIRFAVSAALLLVLARLRGEAIPRDRSTHLSIAVVGIFSFCASYLLVYIGEQWISSGLTAIVFATFPFYIALLAHFGLPDERLGALKLLGVGLGFVGIFVLFRQELGAGESPLGVLMILGASLASAVSNIVGKRLLLRNTVPLVMFNGLSMLYGNLLVWIIWLLAERRTPSVWTAAGVLATLYLVVFGTVISFIAYYWLLKRVDTTRVAMMTFITPIVAMIAGWIFLREAVSPSLLAGSALILLGVFCTWAGSRRPHGAH